MSKFGRVYLDACACVMPRLNRPSEIAMSKDTPNKISAVGRGTVSCALSLQRDDQTTKTAIRNMATPAHSDTAVKSALSRSGPEKLGTGCQSSERNTELALLGGATRTTLILHRLHA